MQANGLAFAVNDGITTLPSSLQNIIRNLNKYKHNDPQKPIQ
jgi:uracil DNA glycosylase